MKQIATLILILAAVGCGKEEIPNPPRVTVNSVTFELLNERTFDSEPGEEAPDLTLHVITDSVAVYTNTLINNCQRYPVALMPTDETFPINRPIKFVILDVDSVGADTVAVFDFIGSRLKPGANRVHINNSSGRLIVGCWVVN